tara:strand:+ start:1474 stop:3084 length:1611 start_codon:yes stop_codon:yes gene_type:complete
MALPPLTPRSQSSKSILPETGSHGNVNRLLPYKIYSDSTKTLYSGNFVSGAVDQVAYVFKKLGGDVLDLEITEGSVYSAYEESVLEYSYIVNVHQANNALPSFLGHATGTFDHKGELTSGPVSASLKYPTFDYGFARSVSETIGAEIGLKDSVQYSASFDVTPGVQDYDLQNIISSRTNTAATGSITITDHSSLQAGDTIKIITTNGTTITATAHADTTTNSNTNSPTFDIGDGSNNATATNLATCLNANSALIATATGADVSIKQVVAGSGGNTDITLTEQSTPNGMTKVNFAEGETIPYAGKINGKKLLIKKVYYKTPSAMWRFYGYYGGLNVVGNFHNYGQYSDDATFELIPSWQNKAQALAYEDAIYTRMSHWSYEIRNNNLRIFPMPYTGGPQKMWVEFSVPTSPVEDAGNGRGTFEGVNNMNTLPFSNLPYDTINSIGKQWIRRFALALSKETLGQVRSKLASIPIPGDSVTLNGGDLISQAKDEQDKLREELKSTLAELTYAKISEQETAIVENAEKVMQKIPYSVYVG